VRPSAAPIAGFLGSQVHAQRKHAFHGRETLACRFAQVDGLDVATAVPADAERARQPVRRLKAKTQAQISRDAWLDESYVSRLFSGERTNPSRDALVLLGAWGLELAVEEVDELLMAADYKPLVLPASIR